jgi:hypothetical protein
MMNTFSPWFRVFMALIALMAACIFVASLTGCASEGDLRRVRGDAYMDGWKDAVKQGARDV